MDITPTKRKQFKTFLAYMLTVVAGVMTGGFFGLVVWFLIWLHWVETVYQPWLNEQLAHGGDDGGSSEGWVLLIGAPPALLIGISAGVLIAHLLFVKRVKQRLSHTPSELRVIH